VIARNAKYRQVERGQKVAAVNIGLGRVVLDDVAGESDEIRRKVALTVMRDYRTKRLVGDSTAQGAVPVGEKMRVRQMQDPDRIS
jgi:hypothetical protein